MLWVALLGLVAALGGLIAYAGDVVGRKIGRKHLRLFGLRPRTTGLVIAVLSGVAVALLSVGAVGLLARDTLNTAIRAQEIRRDLEAAQRELEQLRADSESQRRELRRVKTDRLTLEADLVSANDELSASRAQLSASQQELEATSDVNATLDARILELTASRDALDAERASLIEERARLSRQIAVKSAALDAATRDSAQRVASLDAELRTLVSERAGLRADLAGLRTSRADLEARIAQLIGQKAEAVDSAATARAQLSAAKGQLATATAQLATAARQLKSLDASLNSLRQERQSLETARRNAENAKKELDKEVAGLYQLRANLQTDIDRLETENARLAALAARRDRENRALNTDLRDARTQLQSASRGDFAYRKGELIAQAVLPDGDDASARAGLESLLRQAGAIVESRGAQRGQGVQVEPGPTEIARVARDAASADGPDLVLVRSSQNLAAGQPARVRLERLSNAAVYSATQPIRSRQIALGSASAPVGEPELRAQLKLLVGDALGDLRARKVPLENIPSELITDQELAELIGRLRGLSGTVWVALASRQDVTPAGPLRFYLFILG